MHPTPIQFGTPRPRGRKQQQHETRLMTGIVCTVMFLSRRCGDAAALAFLGGKRGLFSAATGPAALGCSAFVFDIDGVLVRGGDVLPAAQRALRKLYSPDGLQAKLPVAFLTNGGGVTEARKAEQLSEWLGVRVTGGQVVLSHTPFRDLAPQYGQQPVLLCGRGNLPHVAEEYGFRMITTTHQLAAAAPSAVPFWQGWHTPAADARARRHHHSHAIHAGTLASPFRAVFVFTDPGDWYVDLQLVIDVLAGGGVLGRRPEDVPLDAPPVGVFFSNPDLLWANEHALPRFGQGAFAACLQTLHEKLLRRPLSARFFGKPNPEPYRLAERLLEAQAREMGLAPAVPGPAAGACSPPPFAAIYAVGDNPASDVRGANLAGPPWVSVLVRTGVYTGDAGNPADDPATIVVEDVEHAVDAALHRSRSIKWHSMR